MKEIFSYNVDIAKNAYLNWQMQPKNTAYNLEIMAENFCKAADVLIDTILLDNSNKIGDSLIFPILYSIDHSIELYLKAIIREIELLTKGEPSNYSTHDIDSLFNNMMAQIKHKEIKTKGLTKNFESLKKYIDELYRYISPNDATSKPPKIDFARYPIDTSGNAHFYIQAKIVSNANDTHDTNVVVDIENLKKRYEEIKCSLAGIFNMYQAELEDKNTCPA